MSAVVIQSGYGGHGARDLRDVRVGLNERQVLDAALVQELGPVAGKHDSWLAVAGAIFDCMLEREPRLGQPLVDEWLAFVQATALQVCDICMSLAGVIGGDPIYLPTKGLLFQRDREMLARYNGRNGDTLAREYGMTPRRFRQVLDLDRRSRFAQRQGRLDID